MLQPDPEQPPGIRWRRSRTGRSIRRACARAGAPSRRRRQARPSLPGAVAGAAGSQPPPPSCCFCVAGAGGGYYLLRDADPGGAPRSPPIKTDSAPRRTSMQQLPPVDPAPPPAEQPPRRPRRAARSCAASVAPQTEPAPAPAAGSAAAPKTRAARSCPPQPPATPRLRRPRRRRLLRRLPAEHRVAARRRKIRRYVDEYDGGDCFFVAPVAIGETGRSARRIWRRPPSPSKCSIGPSSAITASRHRSACGR